MSLQVFTFGVVARPRCFERNVEFVMKYPKMWPAAWGLLGGVEGAGGRSIIPCLKQARRRLAVAMSGRRGGIWKRIERQSGIIKYLTFCLHRFLGGKHSPTTSLVHLPRWCNSHSPILSFRASTRQSHSSIFVPCARWLRPSTRARRHDLRAQ